MEVENNNIKWHSVLLKWVELYKRNDEALLTPERGKDGSLIMEFNTHKNELLHHLELVKGWLSACDMSGAMKQIPTVGKMLSLLCKLPFVVACDSFSTLIIDCMLLLSDLFSIGDSTNSSKKRAKTWAVENITSLCAYQCLGGVELFLMDEFGVSQEELMLQHLKCLSEGIGSFIGCKCFVQDDSESKNLKENFSRTVTDAIVLINDPLIIPLVENIIIHEYETYRKHGNYDNLFFLDGVKDWLLQTMLLSEIKLEILCKLFTLSFEVYEHFIVSIIEQCLHHYPFVYVCTIESLLHEYKMVMLTGKDEKYFKGFLQIVKETFSVVGNHPALILLLKIVMKYHTNNISGSNDKLGLQKPKEFVDCRTWAEMTKQSLQLFYSDEESDDSQNSRQCFELWFGAVQSFEENVEELIFSILQKKVQNLQVCVDTLLWFFYPVNYREVSLCNLPLTAYIKSLRNLATKKHLQLTDIQYLLENLKKNLTVDMSVILIVIHVTFCFICVGAQTFVDSVFKMVFEVQRNNDVEFTGKSSLLFWFLTSIESSLNRINNIPQQTGEHLKTFLKHQILSETTAETHIDENYKEELIRYFTERIDGVTIVL